MLDLELWREIYNSVRCNNIGMLQAALSQRPSPETINHGDPKWAGKTPLHWASSNGNFEIIKLLVEAGANVYATDKNGKTLLHHLLAVSSTEVISNSFKEIFAFLTDAGATVDGATAKISPLVPSDVIRAIVPENTPFWLAANNDAPKLAAELAGGLDPNMKTENGMTLLHWACAGDAPECVQLLLDAGADKEAGEPKAVFYCKHESSVCLECMINYGVDVNQGSIFDYHTKYPIHLALAANSPACVTALVGAGAWVTEEEMSAECGSIPLASALIMYPLPVDALRALLAAAGERMLSEKIEEMPPLYWAVEHSTVDVVRVLVEAGFDVDDMNDDQTPLILASVCGTLEVVQLLIEAGADVNAFDDNDQTSLHSASFNGHLEVASLLVEAGANVDATDKDGSTPLHLASSSGHLEIVKLLIEAGAYVDATDEDGKTPKQLALGKKHNAVVKLLSEAHDTQFTALKKENEELRSQNTTLEHEVTILRETVTQTKMELLASQRRCEQLQSEVQTPPAATASSSSAVAELQRRLDTTQRRLDDAKEDRDDYIAKNAELRKQIKALELYLPSTHTNGTSFDDLREQLNAYSGENARQQEAIRQLNDRVAELQETIDRGNN